ncbi:hypothetical protein Mp_4g02710 [Marchantia polymorpha subsp. ruderalis]|uniref:Uncharacterized protein n=2 Tax=Marchantia polymorpha TaxID=3197 RepID=A0AAF6B5L5_MARPO|nr:hypothetical protein MARPO_0080s0028 [Marchantia polymorpha]BBN07299.1 hypothetical protein Mp_4g02710 [Marchantia polymorpha subsp. ruderalis]|eukprot:PTQ34405.1 hypothetical protein MARPO_0080s0028 [Marchantia polymorpha]
MRRTRSDLQFRVHGRHHIGPVDVPVPKGASPSVSVNERPRLGSTGSVICLCFACLCQSCSTAFCLEWLRRQM